MSEDAKIREILTAVKTIALVGWSPKADRPSHGVAAYLARRGYRVIPVNPGQAGQQALGETVRASLAEIEGSVDMVEIFRRSSEAGAVVDAALAAFPNLSGLDAVGCDRPSRRQTGRGAWCAGRHEPLPGD